MTNHIAIPIFPLPRFVAFPGHVHQFHIFEPRYRRMVRDCLAHDLELGVSLAQRALSRPRMTSESLEEQFNSNQTTFEPSKICSAGPVELIEVLPDGRMIVEVSFERRIRVDGFCQAVPYYKGEGYTLAEQYPDRHESDRMFDELIGLSHRILGSEAATFRSFLAPLVFEQKQLDRLVYGILQWFRPEPSVAQLLLEESRVAKRATVVIHLMKAFLEASSTLEFSGYAVDDDDEDISDQHAPHDYIIQRKDNVIRVDFTTAAEDRSSPA